MKNLFCPYCGSERILVSGKIEATGMIRNGEFEIIQYGKKLYNDDSPAKCTECNKEGVIWFFKKRG